MHCATRHHGPAKSSWRKYRLVESSPVRSIIEHRSGPHVFAAHGTRRMLLCTKHTQKWKTKQKLFDIVGGKIDRINMPSPLATFRMSLLLYIPYKWFYRSSQRIHRCDTLLSDHPKFSLKITLNGNDIQWEMCWDGRCAESLAEDDYTNKSLRNRIQFECRWYTSSLCRRAYNILFSHPSFVWRLADDAPASSFIFIGGLVCVCVCVVHCIDYGDSTLIYIDVDSRCVVHPAGDEYPVCFLLMYTSLTSILYENNFIYWKSSGKSCYWVISFLCFPMKWALIFLTMRVSMLRMNAATLSEN